MDCSTILKGQDEKHIPSQIEANPTKMRTRIFEHYNMNKMRAQDLCMHNSLDSAKLMCIILVIKFYPCASYNKACQKGNDYEKSSHFLIDDCTNNAVFSSHINGMNAYI